MRNSIIDQHIPTKEIQEIDYNDYDSDLHHSNHSRRFKQLNHNSNANVSAYMGSLHSSESN